MSSGALPRGRPLLWAALGVLVIIGAIAGLVVSTLSRPVYTATATSFLSSQGRTAVTDLAQGGGFTQQVLDSYASVATSPVVLNRVIRTLGLRTTAGELAERVHAENAADTALIRISATDGSPEEAAAIANAVQAELGRRVQAVSPSGGDAEQTMLTPVGDAKVPAGPSSPSAALDLAIGALAGAAAWLLALLARAIRRFRPPPSGGTVAPSML